MTDAELLDALRDCYAPRDPRNIVAAGLVVSAALTRDDDAPGAMERYLASIVLTAPGSDETVNAMLAAQVENRLLGLQAISRVGLTLRPALFTIL